MQIGGLLVFQALDGTFVPYWAATRRPTMRATTGGAMKLFPVVLIVAAALLAACSTEPVSPEQRAADQCRMFRGYMSTQEHFRVMEACTRQLGEEACRKCLWE
jgi:hypothetical protein